MKLRDEITSAFHWALEEFIDKRGYNFDEVSDAWDLLVEKGLLSEIIQSYQNLEQAKPEIRRAVLGSMASFEQGVPRRGPEITDEMRSYYEGLFSPKLLIDKEEEARARAISECHAWQLSFNEDVMDYRGRYLPDGGTLDRTTAFEYLKQYSSEIIDEDEMPFMVGSGDKWLRVNVGEDPNNRLFILRKLSEKIARYYGWSEAETAWFILTGVAPTPLPIQVITERCARGKGNRIILSIESWISPETVKEAYQAVVNDLSSGWRKGRKGKWGIRISEMFRFIVNEAKKGESQDVEEWRAGSTWEEAMGRWNNLVPSLMSHWGIEAQGKDDKRKKAKAFDWQCLNWKGDFQPLCERALDYFWEHENIKVSKPKFELKTSKLKCENCIINGRNHSLTKSEMSVILKTIRYIGPRHRMPKPNQICDAKGCANNATLYVTEEERSKHIRKFYCQQCALEKVRSKKEKILKGDIPQRDLLLRKAEEEEKALLRVIEKTKSTFTGD